MPVKANFIFRHGKAEREKRGTSKKTRRTVYYLKGMKRMKNENLLEKADRFVVLNKDQTVMRYRPRFHAAAPTGWINDPNGFHYDGKHYQLFYQHYPYEARWNDMHWGHWKSSDLALWEDMPVAMAPDRSYDESGCFSGTALPDGKGGAHILYTGVSEKGTLQQQCLAYFDGKNVVKSEKNPVIPFSLLPEGYVRQDFRDPKLIWTADGYRAVMAAKHSSGGRLVCFSSSDLENWRFCGVFCETEGIMPECPDVFKLDGKTVTMYSMVGDSEKPGENNRPVLYSVGNTNAEETIFTAEKWLPLDHGMEFYAAQTCLGENGERIVIGWLASWEAEYPTALLSHGWSGLMSVPRVLHVKDGRLYQEPAPGLKNRRKENKRLTCELKRNHVKMEGVCARHAEIHFSADVSRAETVTLNVMEDSDEQVSLSWRDGILLLDRSATAYNRLGKFVPEVRMPVKAVNGRIDMTVYVDNCTVEVFANGEIMSAIAFPKGEAYGISVMAEGDAAVQVDCWELA